MKNSYLTILCLFLLMGQKAWGETVSKNVHFSYSELKVDSIVADDGHTYNKLLYRDLWNEDGEVGCPTIPIKYISIPIPYSAENISLDVERKNIFSNRLNNKIFPVQRDIPTQMEIYNKAFVPCDSIIYKSSSPYPQHSSLIVSIPCLGSDYRFVRIGLYPVVYYPAMNLIEFAEDFDITVRYSIPTAQTTGKSHHSRQANSTGLPFYEYCIITNNELKDSFSRLISWRKQNGYNAGVICIEDILDNSCLIGDTVSSIFDDAGKVRQYLQYAYDSGITKYILFGGNYQVLPIRYGTGRIVNESKDTIIYRIPSDFYFSELDSNWKKDNDSYYGEQTDTLNYGSKLYVGRLLCTNSEEVQNYTDKLLRYELNPGNGDFSYLKKALYTQADEMQSINEAENVAFYFHDIFPIDTIFSETPSYDALNPISPYGSDIIAEMNNHYGYVSLCGHGNPTSIAVKTDSVKKDPMYGITCIQADTIPWIMSESANGLDNLTNKDYPMIVYSTSCTITPFDVIEGLEEYTSIGQSLTLGKDYGGPALIGNTREGLVYTSGLYQIRFNEYVINKPLGESLAYARASFCSPARSPHFLSHSTNLIGCPLIRLWTDIPTLFSATLSYNSNSYIISANNSIIDANIGIRDITQPNEAISTISFNPSQGPKTLTNAQNSLITLTGKNCLPQILPLTLQNVTLQGTHHVIAKNVTCGKDARNGSQGDVIFDEGSDYTFETNGTFELTRGVEIKQGAKLEVIPSEINF